MVKPSVNFVCVKWKVIVKGPLGAPPSKVEWDGSHGEDGVGAAGSRCGVINSNPSSASGTSLQVLRVWCVVFPSLEA